MNHLLLSFIVFLISAHAFSQDFFRIKADFSLKEKSSEGKTVLTMGTVYYDKKIKKIVYLIKFPEKETWVMEDSLFYRVIEKKILQTQKIQNLAQTSIFNICLNGKLPNYGLNDFQYKIDSVEKSDGMVITTWRPPEKIARTFGKIVLSQKEKKLFGMAYFNPGDVLVSKQFFKNYTNVDGLEFPGEIIQITYSNGKENYQITTYKNIVINEISNDENYNFSVTH